jgi:hypothetical protein
MRLGHAFTIGCQGSSCESMTIDLTSVKSRSGIRAPTPPEF